MGVGDSKPASAPLSTSPGNSYLSSAMASIQYAPPTTPGVSSASYDTTVNLLLPPSQSGQQPQQTHQQQASGSRQITPQSSQTMLHSNRASPQPYSPSAQQQYFDLPTRAVSPGSAAMALTTPAPLPTTPGASTSAATVVSSANAHLVERPDLHKSLKALESLLVNLDEYRDLSARLAKVEKKLAKSTSELERTKVVLDTPAQTLQLTSTMFEGLAEVSSKHAKHVQKEYEAVNDACAKYFKKVAKEERAHDELVQTLDAKIKKANAAHEKNVKKATANKALESHDKYIATVQALTNDISRAKNQHAVSMAAKSHVSSLLVASTVGGLADVEFKRRCESVRRVGAHVGRLNELLCFTSSEFMPALQASELGQAEHGQAEYLASLAAQVEAQVAAQAQINAKINEDTQMILRAQELGWRPPSPLAPPSASYANLGRSNSIGSNTSRSADNAASNHQAIQPATSNSNLAGSASTSTSTSTSASASASANNLAAAPTSSSSLQQPEREGARSRSNSSTAKFEPAPNTTATSPTPLAADNDTATVRTVVADETPRLASGTFQTQTSSASPSAPLVASRGSDGLGDVRLDRAPTGSTLKSLAARPETWEEAPTSSASSAVGRLSRAPSAHDRDRTGSSAQEGSIVDRLAVPRDGSDAVPPSLSASNSAQGSEDGNRIPRTPDDSEAIPPMQGSRNGILIKPQQRSKDADMLDYPNVQPAAVASSNKRPAQRALEQYREQTTKAATSPTAPRFDRHSAPLPNDNQALGPSDSIYTTTSQQSSVLTPEQANARKVSLWERERERMRQLEREEELSSANRTLVSVTSELHNYSRPTSAIYSTSTAASCYNNGGWSRSKMSESSASASDKLAGSQLGLGYPRADGTAGVHDLDRYAPAVGSTRLSAVGVTRSLSTDTTASERSFVARMKARYQAEKDLEREQRELNVLEKERAARRATMDPNLSLNGGGRGRVPEIASRYQMSGPPTYAQEVNPARRYHDSLPAIPNSNGMSRVSAISSAPSAGGRNGVDEFGNITRGTVSSSTFPSSNRTSEPPHSDVCGCHQCSARHYGSGSGGTTNSSSSTRKDPREFNVRRSTMPIPPRSDSHTQQQYARNSQQQAAYASSPPSSGNDGYYYRQQQQQQQLLNAPKSSGREGGSSPRRSYDDLVASGDVGSRRVVFAHEPQTIR